MKRVYDLVIKQTIPHYFSASEKAGHLTFNFEGNIKTLKLSNRLEKIEYRCSKINNYDELTTSLRDLDKKLESKIILLKYNKLPKALENWRKGRIEQKLQPKVEEMKVSYEEVLKIATEIL